MDLQFCFRFVVQSGMMRTPTENTKKILDIAAWPAHERPRERLLKNGPEALSTAELIAICLRTGCRGKTALDLAREILARSGGLAGLGQIPWKRIRENSGIGPAKWAQVLAALELGRRVQSERIQGECKRISSPREAAECLKVRLSNLAKERFQVMYLNSLHHVLHIRDVALGTVDQAFPIPREIFETAFELNAAACICAHNHPSGDTTPSRDDIAFTQRLVSAGRVLNLRILDHIIIAGQSYSSMVESGILPTVFQDDDVSAK
jgi:DNA repair protein RadC